ncbi:MAG: DUF3017 domain-containing protein [Nostocoides sp.]
MPHLASWWVLAVGVLAAVVFGATAHPLRATYAFAVALLVAGGMRALLPDVMAGGLVVRHRATDVITLLVLAVAVFVIGQSMNLHPHV